MGGTCSQELGMTECYLTQCAAHFEEVCAAELCHCVSVRNGLSGFAGNPLSTNVAFTSS